MIEAPSAAGSAKIAITDTHVKELSTFVADLYRQAIIESHQPGNTLGIWETRAGRALEYISPGIKYDAINTLNNQSINQWTQRHVDMLRIQQNFADMDSVLGSHDPYLFTNAARRYQEVKAGKFFNTASEAEFGRFLRGHSGARIPEGLGTRSALLTEAPLPGTTLSRIAADIAAIKPAEDLPATPAIRYQAPSLSR